MTTRPRRGTATHRFSSKLMDEDDWTHEGNMSFIDNELSEDTATIRVKAVFKNPDLFLAPGVFGRLRLPGSAPYEALLLPDTAIVSDQSNKIVLIVNAENIVEPRVVTLGPLHEGLRVIRSGIGKDDRVIINGLQRARPGAPVLPQDGAIALRDGSTPSNAN